MKKGLELFQIRFNEITNYLKDGDIDQVVAKLTFFTEDFATEFHQESILLQGELRRIKKEIIETGPSNELRNLENQIARRAFLLLKEIEKKSDEQQKSISLIKSNSKNKIKNLNISEPLDSDASHTPDSNFFAGKEMVVAKKLLKEYGSFLFGPIDFKLKQGEITSITGINGSGKSTLLGIIAGEIKRDEGELLFDLGSDPFDWSEIKKKIGFLSQQLKYPPNINTRNLLNYSAAINEVPKNKINNLVSEYVIRLGVENESYKNLSQLSQGYRLRIELARILMLRPKILILDEPLANLDFISRHTLLTDLRNFTNSINFPMTTIISSHSIEEIEVIADNFIVLDNGEVLFSGSKDEYYSLLDEDVFEVITNVNINYFVSKLSEEFTGIKMFQLGMFQILFMPKKTAIYALLKSATAYNIDFLYIQDVSKTTKSLIIVNHIKKYGLEPFQIN